MVVLQRLGRVCDGRGLEALAERLQSLAELARDDLGSVEAALQGLERPESLVGRSAGHLLGLAGKRLRPLCVALAARAGKGFGQAARDFAVAAELVHNATLLHDDVLDAGEERRGAPTSRALYGNAASVLAGDWLLTEALRRVRLTSDAVALDRLIDTIGAMISAESVQLERRHHLDPDRATYLKVVEGKTAALFRWALFAGARAGELPPELCEALERYGAHLGVAFQLVDDLLDYAGKAGLTGKRLFADLREGKMTWPLLLAVERDPGLAVLLRAVLDGTEESPAPIAVGQRVLRVLEDTGAIADTRALARERVDQAIDAIALLPGSPAARGLLTVAHAALERES